MSVATAEPTIRAAAAASSHAASELRAMGRGGRARALRAVAAALRGDHDLVAIASAETHLDEVRLRGEIERTASQAELFADVIVEGSYLDAAVDHASANGPELRRIRVPVGPVVVFAAGNFPFAFGVFGGDTVSALAAGCPVIVKAHPDLPMTSMATFGLVREALAGHAIPPDALQIVTEADAGRALVEAPSVAAVGFTGSAAGGRALFDFAAARPVPIPVFAEMSSTNPTIIAPEAARTDVAGLAQQLVSAVTSSAGQLCTKPGLIFLPRDALALIEAISELLAVAEPRRLLSSNITERYLHRLAELRAGGAEERTPGSVSPSGVAPTLVAVPIEQLNGTLTEETFGPATVLVTYAAFDDLAGALSSLGGQLTTTVHAVDGDFEMIEGLVDVAAATSGRVVVNGVPTGVRVAWSTTHGGPYPASTSPSSTSVGASAIDRWTRPVTWQSTPDRFLPDELREDPREPVPTRVDGVLLVGASSVRESS
ncbi:aldehyde dehydrogenase family protein [Pseudoclavibacter sp. VKM Ac-2867]|uniref:aldehyde dehydrogenase family protein n=1 Tax=Pseudoclavibacter sp. VKM Ac-2867 TaxID=2783829 RepID=UPI00188A981F|nr:aldehyde dehydrogenase family protein [Pseudoclavibacter sp. VKM Ac-2867]MBF4458744.1 aldehyde dehydrogenase family protein [Pseudoclavibacter sp. VKM Ac-2867]